MQKKKLIEIKCLSAYSTTKNYHILTVYPTRNTVFDHFRLHNPVKYFFFFKSPLHMWGNCSWERLSNSVYWPDQLTSQSMKVAELLRPSEDGAHNSNYSPRKRNGWWVSQPSTWHLPSTSMYHGHVHSGRWAWGWVHWHSARVQIAVSLVLKWQRLPRWEVADKWFPIEWFRLSTLECELLPFKNPTQGCL